MEAPTAIIACKINEPVPGSIYALAGVIITLIKKNKKINMFL
jgi:hypothetical protein